jgi:hypothetical protein
MEGRLGQAPLSPVITVRAGGQAIAEYLPDSVIERPALVKGPVVHEDLVSQLRATHDIHRPTADPDPDEVNASRKRSQESQRVTQ